VPARELVLSAPGQGQPELVTKFTAADVLLFTSRRGSEGSPTVVKEACVMGLPVVSVDVGDVAETLAEVTPSAVVEFPGDRTALVARLADATVAVLAAGSRSDGRTRNAWLDSDQVAARIEAVYRKVLSA
jgi:glycosyltransferase involved in cell wall biosynthesis